MASSDSTAPENIDHVDLEVDGVAMVRLLGAQDRLLATIEKQYPLVDVHVRGNHVALSGEAAQVQAATELGVDGVIPWTAARSISRWEGAKIAKGRDRWTAVVREASKQSLRAWIPDVLDLVTTKQLVRLTEGARILVLEPTAAQTLGDLEVGGEDLILVVGPEGGISPQELDALAAAGASVVRLGDEVLRTSTAGPAALAVLNVKLRRW